ncbi:glutathione S-transferase-like [Homalodisca vitripennis]|uniref:glutathione S-transferase-like n=1 Tax=Homalodisca vitripennis TaxID=197043 RepID=UPI001EEAB673|nr:glutathione S-transferase-like [Homalodisca vitripennis]
MHNKKAPGPDGIPAEVLKVVAASYPLLLLNIFSASTPWGQTPVLEANGLTVTRSIAITRYLGRQAGLCGLGGYAKVQTETIAIAQYLGRQAGLCGADAWEDMRIDETVYVINNFHAELAKCHYERHEKRKKEVKGTLFSTSAPFYLAILDAHVKANNGYLANEKLSWADLYFAAISDYLSSMYGSDISAGYPNLTELREKILALPKIKEWVSKRPVTNV